MEFEVKQVDSFTRQLKIRVEPQELAEIEAQVVRKVQKSAEVPGFRKGRAPASIIRQRYGDTIKIEIIDQAISKFYGEALEAARIFPIAQGEVNNLLFENVQNGLEFEIEVEVEPEIELKKYKGLKVEKELPVITEEMVEQALENLREEFAVVKEVEVIEEGCYVTFDAQEIGEGNVPVLGRKIEDFTVQVGSGKFDLEFERQLIGLAVDEKAIIEKISPAPENIQKNEPIREAYQITIKSIQEKEIPALNDEFVKNLGEENLETPQQLKERIRHNLQIEMKQRSEEQFRTRLIDELLKENPFDVPPTLVEHLLNQFIDDIKNQSTEGEIDEEMIRQNYRASAIHNIRWYLLKRKISEVENINVSMREVEALIDQAQIDSKQKRALKRDSRHKEHLRDDLLEQRILEFLESHAEIIEIFPQATPEVPRAEKTTGIIK